MLGLDTWDKLKKLPGKCFISIHFMGTFQSPTQNAQYEIIYLRFLRIHDN